jgi:uncharacterized protein (UPF0332 family)
LNKFNFNEHATDSFAVIRMFVNKYNKESKINDLIFKKVNEFSERKKLVKKQKLDQKKLDRKKLQWFKHITFFKWRQTYSYLS